MFARIVATLIVTLALAASVFSQAVKLDHITVGVTADSLSRNQASLNFDVSNPGTTSATIKRISAQIGTLVVPVISFNHTFSNLVVPAGDTVNSGTIQNASLSLGIISLVQLLLLPTMDIISGEMTLGMQQSGIPTNFTLGLI